ncbi:MAG: glycosyltransferase family 2 protein [Candidatus Babeliales bacterium]
MIIDLKKQLFIVGIFSLYSLVYSGFNIISSDVPINQNRSLFLEKLQRAVDKTVLESPLIFDEAMVEKSIVVLIPSYNNALWYQENLNSVFGQNYTNYRVIYIDDCSADKTGALVEEYIAHHNQVDRVTLIKNNKRKLAMANIYTAITEYCHDDEIIVMLDGDDFLAQKNVLKYINYLYSIGDIWLTYGSNLFLSTNTSIGWAEPFPDAVIINNRFREFRYGLTHMRTFYAWLFKKINKEDFMYHNDFIPMTSDVAMYLPMIEMAGKRHLFVDKILYLYNDLNQISDYRVNSSLQWGLNLYVRRKKKYAPLVYPA